LKELDGEDMPEEDLVDCVKDNVESLGLSRSREDAQFRNKRRRRIKGETS